MATIGRAGLPGVECDVPAIAIDTLQTQHDMDNAGSVTWDNVDMVARRVEAAIREADDAGEIWTLRLAGLLVALDDVPLGAEASMARRLRRRIRTRSEDLAKLIRGATGHKVLDALLAYETEEIDVLVAEHAACLSPSQLACLVRRRNCSAKLLRNRTQGPVAQVEIGRHCVAGLNNRTSTRETIDILRAVLSLPAKPKEAIWRDVPRQRLLQWGMEAFAEPYIDLGMVDRIASTERYRARMVALSRPDVSAEMEERLLGGEEMMLVHLGMSWEPPDAPSPRAMRCALRIWPRDARLALRVAGFPDAPLDVLRDIVRGSTGEGCSDEMICALAERDDALADPEIRRTLLADPVPGTCLAYEVTDGEFPALFRDLARTPEGAGDALSALEVRLGGGRCHGLALEDLAPIFVAGDDLARRAMTLMPKVHEQRTSTATARGTEPHPSPGVRR